MGFFFLLEKAEYLRERIKTKKYVIRLCDISFTNKNGGAARTMHEATAVLVSIRGSKTDQVGVGTTRIQQRSGSRWACPVLALWEFVSHCQVVRVPNDEPICSIAPGVPLRSKAMSWAIKNAATCRNEDPKRYGTHSLRSGRPIAPSLSGIDHPALYLEISRL